MQDVGIIYYSIQFSLGTVCALLNINSNIYVNKKYIKSILFLICLIFFMITLNSWNILYKITNCLSSLIITLIISKFINKLNIKCIEFIGSISYELYLLESIFMRQYKFIFNLLNNALVAFIVYLTVIITLSIIIQKIIQKISNINKIYIQEF